MSVGQRLAQAYSSPVQSALGVQIIFVLWFGSLLDGGVVLRAFLYSSLAYWAGTVLILLRRPSNPTRGDLLYIRWGLVGVGLLGMVAFP
jgi:hypothetical protein